MNALLAQFNNNAFGNNNNANNGGPPPEFWIIFAVIMGVAILIGLVIAIFFLLTLSKALGRCSPENRTMEPAMVWLNLIPCLNIVWQFVTVTRLSKSLTNEFRDRRMGARDDDYGKSVGTAYCVLNLLGWIPYIGTLFSLAGLVCFILYWVKIAGYSKQLANDPGYGDDEDEDYDRPSRRRRISDDDDYDR